MAFYLMPITGSGLKTDPRRPKYSPAGAWAMCDFGGSCVVYAASSDASVEAQPDVTVVPALDNSVAVVATQNALEALNIPAQWISTGMSYRAVLRVVVGMAQLVQRCLGLGVNVQPAGNLDLTMAQIPAATRNAIASACDSLAIDRSSIIASTTLREALRIFGQQFDAGKTIALGDL